MAVCSGKLLAARAGLVDRRKCTTHHELLAVLRANAPSAQVIDNRVFVMDGPVASSAGVTAGIDLALHLIAEECGEALAAAVAEDLVVYFRRSPTIRSCRRSSSTAGTCTPRCTGSRTPSSPALGRVGHGEHGRGGSRHRAAPVPILPGARGVSPLQFLRAVRLERARQALECGAGVGRAAESAGFRSALQLRRAWSRQWGGSPRDLTVRTPAGV